MSHQAEDARDASYEQGRRQALAGMLSHLAREFAGGDDEKRQLAALLAERAAVVAVLRRVCEEHGDNDWPENLHLVDVIEKHLARHIDES